MRTLAPSTIAPSWRGVVRTRKSFAHDATDGLRKDAAEAVARAFEGVSGKRIDAAHVPDCGRHGISRAINGSSTNPLYRIALMFVVLRRLGMPRERAVWMVEWLRRLVDAIWPEEEAPALEEALEKDGDLDVLDDAERVRAYRGDPEALARYLDAKMVQLAHAPAVIQAIRRRLAAGAHTR